jgi:hypothetical protein
MIPDFPHIIEIGLAETASRAETLQSQDATTKIIMGPILSFLL